MLLTASNGFAAACSAVGAVVGAAGFIMQLPAQPRDPLPRRERVRAGAIGRGWETTPSVSSCPAPPCISHLPGGAKPARLKTDGSPRALGADEPVGEHGAPSVGSSGNPNSRSGRYASPRPQGRVMDQPPVFVGI